jgi:DNA-binding SARP family transcriptional activator
MGLKILTLGAASLLFNEQSLDAQLGTKARAILLYVALQGTAVSREKLAAMFW